MGLPRPPQRGGYVRLHSLANCVSGVAKNTSRSDSGGDTTRFAQTVSPLSGILAPFLTPDTMPEITNLLTLSVQINSANEQTIMIFFVKLSHT